MKITRCVQRNIRGFSALTVLVLLVLLSLYANVGSLLIAPGEGEGGAVLAAERSLNLADAGLRHAMLTLKQNWGGWNDANNFPQRSFTNGTYDPAIADDSDGDNNTALDSNNKLVVTVSGTMGDSTRQVRATVNRYHGAMGSAIYTTGTLTTSGNAHLNGSVTQQGASIPGLDVVAAIAAARANLDNGYTTRADGNYFQGEFPDGGAAPQSLNGIIFIDRYPGGAPANVNISGNIETTAGNPAFLIVDGNLNVSGNITFNGLMYVTGQATTHIAMSGNATITGGIISSNDIATSGNLTVTYDAGNVSNSTTTGLLIGEDSPTIESWAEYFP